MVEINLQKPFRKIFLRKLQDRYFDICFHGRLMLKQLADLTFREREREREGVN